MAFADPIALTIGGATKNLVRVDSGRFASEYRLVEALQEFSLVIRNQDVKPEQDGRRKQRHNISFRQRIFATATTPEIVRESSVVISHYAGDDVTAFDDGAIAVAGMVTVANVAKLANFES
nr:MAG: hypothetical protein 2 [Leviviridae sp.]